MPVVGELRPLRDPATGRVLVFVYLAEAHGRELWEDVGTGRQIWVSPVQRAGLEAGS